MPKPVLKENNLIKIINENIKLLSELDTNINISIKYNKNEIFLNSDKEQIGRVFFNLIKNSIESIHQKSENSSIFEKKISIEVNDTSNHILITIVDNGIGFGKLSDKINEISNPYFTTKKNGTGLGLSIVNKIINDHNGQIEFIAIDDGAKIKIDFIK